MVAELLPRYIVAPALVGALTMVVQRWGPAAGGLWNALPVTAAPILLVLAIDEGADFAATAAHATFLAVVAITVFGLLYTYLARASRWPACFLVASTGYLVVTAVLAAAAMSLPWSLAAVAIALALGRIAARSGNGSRPAIARAAPREVWLRMSAALVMVLGITAMAPALGAYWAGLLAPYPVVASVVMCFTHARAGNHAVRTYAGGLLAGLPSFAVFNLALALALVPLGVGPAFCLATAGALVSQLVLQRSHTRRLLEVAA